MAEKKTGSGGQALDAAAGLVGADKLGEIAGGTGANSKPAAQPAVVPGTVPGAAQVDPGAAPVPGADPGAVVADPAQTVKPKVGGPAAVPGQPVQAAAIEPIVVKTPLGKKVYGKAPDGEEDVVLSSFEDVKSFANVFNIELKDVNDLQGFIKEYDKLKAGLVSASATKATLDNYERSLKGLPTEVSMILDAALNGQDYGTIINSIAQRGILNFEKGFADYPERDLINHYSDTKYDKDEFENMDEQQYKALRMMANTRYDTDQLTYSNNIATQQRTADLTKQNFDQSVEKSIAQLKANNPDMGEAEIQRIRNIMNGELHGTLFDQDNTYKPEAAERLAMQEFGAETILAQSHTISDLVAKHTAAGRSEATEQILQRSDNRELSGAGLAPGDNAVSQAVKDATSFMGARG